MLRRPKQGNSTAAARMANHDLMDNPPYLGAGGATNVEVEDDLSGNMLETCIDDTVSLSDPKEGGKHVSFEICDSVSMVLKRLRELNAVVTNVRNIMITIITFCYDMWGWDLLYIDLGPTLLK